MESVIVSIEALGRSRGLPARERNKAPRLFFHPKSETVAENLQGRRYRPYELYRKLLPEVVRQAVSPWGEPVFDEDARFVWSQHAGCSRCPCSPGFIARDGWRAPVDVYVTVDAEAHEVMVARQGSLDARRQQRRVLAAMGQPGEAALPDAA